MGYNFKKQLRRIRERTVYTAIANSFKFYFGVYSIIVCRNMICFEIFKDFIFLRAVLGLQQNKEIQIFPILSPAHTHA